MNKKPFSIGIHPDWPTCLMLHPELPQVIIGTNSGEILVLDYKAERILRRSKISDYSIRCLYQYFNSNFFFAACHTIHYLSFDLKQLNKFTGNIEPVIGLGVNLNKMLYSASEDGSVKSCQIDIWKFEQLYKHDSSILAFDYSEEVNIIATFAKPEIIIYSIDLNRILGRHKNSSVIRCLKVINRTYIYFGNDLGEFICFDYLKGSVDKVLSLHKNKLKYIEISRDSNILTVGLDNTVNILNEKCDKRNSFFIKSEGVPISASFSRDGQYIITLTESGFLAENKMETDVKSSANVPINQNERSRWTYLVSFVFLLIFLSIMLSKNRIDL